MDSSPHPGARERGQERPEAGQRPGFLLYGLICTLAQRSLEQYDEMLDGAPGVSLSNLADLSVGVSLTERGGFGAMVKVE